MAVTECDACGRDRTEADSCTEPGTWPYSRTVDDEARWSWRRWPLLLPARCRGCGVSPGGWHHVGCVVAVCSEDDEHGAKIDCPCHDEPEADRADA